MNRLPLTCLLLVALWGSGCGSRDKSSKDAPNGKADPGKKEGKATAKDTVVIDGDAQERSGIRVADVEPREIAETLMAAGQIAVNEDRTVHVGTYTDGRITEVLATVGDFVKNGQVLARIHSHSLHETRASYEIALQDVSMKENAVAYSQRLAMRIQNLYAVKSASVQEVERAEAEVLNAKTNLKNAQINAEKEREHLADILRVDPSQLPATLNEQIDVVPILSSITGTVIDRKVTAGTVVQPGDETFTVTDLSSVWMLASVNEKDVGKLTTGRHARVLTQSYPNQPFKGIVTRLGTQMDPQTRTLQARITVPNARMQLRPEMFANSQIEEGASHKAVFIPEDAIQDINGSPVVFLRGTDNKFLARPVELVRTLNGEAEIRSGLKAGDHIVVKGSFVVKSELLKSQIGE